ncbi:MAG: peptide MFS transporter [Pseudomonadota bacterium]
MASTAPPLGDTPETIAAPARGDTRFFGHPIGLAYLAFTEAGERFSFFGMQTLLVLYMVKQLLLPGHIENVAGMGPFSAAITWAYGPLNSQGIASAIYGLYAALIFLTPIFGGALADRYLGRTRTIALGGILMCLGHLLMAFDISFLAALVLLVLGTGCFKGNIASQVGSLYAPDDPRQADAFQIFYIAMSIGIISAPLICGTLGEIYGWHYGFAAAAIGMVISLAIYVHGRKHFGEEVIAAKADAVAVKLDRADVKIVLLLLVMLPLLAVTGVANAQIYNAYLLWAPVAFDLTAFGRTIPTTWLITFSAVIAMVFLFLTVTFWRAWRRRFAEPSDLSKIVIGAALSALGQLMLYAAALQAGDGGKASLIWLVLFNLINAIAVANIYPIALSLFARVSPKAVVSTMIGVLYLHQFIGGLIVGWVGGFLSKMPADQFWLLHVGIAAGAVVGLLLYQRVLGRMFTAEGEQAAA